MLLWSGLGLKNITSALKANATTFTIASAPVGIAFCIAPNVSPAYKVSPTVQFQASNLTIEPGKATFIASVSAFASRAIPIRPLQVATASASTSSHFPPLPKYTKSPTAEEYPEANESVVGPVQ